MSSVTAPDAARASSTARRRPRRRVHRPGTRPRSRRRTRPCRLQLRGRGAGGRAVSCRLLLHRLTWRQDDVLQLQGGHRTVEGRQKRPQVGRFDARDLADDLHSRDDPGGERHRTRRAPSIVPPTRHVSSHSPAQMHTMKAPMPMSSSRRGQGSSSAPTALRISDGAGDVRGAEATAVPTRTFRHEAHGARAVSERVDLYCAVLALEAPCQVRGAADRRSGRRRSLGSARSRRVGSMPRRRWSLKRPSSPRDATCGCRRGTGRPRDSCGEREGRGTR